MNREQKYWMEAGSRYRANFERRKARQPGVFELQESKVHSALSALGHPVHHVLEVGCGFGRFTRMISGMFLPRSYVAVDLSPDQIDEAKKYCSGHSVNFRIGRAEDLVDFAQIAPVDLVFASEVLMHLRAEAAEEVYTQMLSNGLSIMTVDVVPSEGHELWKYSFAHPYAEWARHPSTCVEVIPVGKQAITVVTWI